MTAAMAATPQAPAGRPARALRRDPSRRLIAGVCAGIAGELGVDPLVVRVAFVAGAAAGGVGVVVYALAWLLTPSTDAAAQEPRRRRTGRGAVEVGLGVALLVLAALLALRATGIWFSDALTWPLVLLAGGGALLWRQSVAAPATSATAPAASATAPAMSATRPAAAPAPAGSGDAGSAAPSARRAQAVSRTGLGVALVVAAGVTFLQATGALGAARDALLAVLVAAVVLGVIFVPWIVGLLRSRDEERAARIRSQERAELSAHLHDSVLQTLALVQKRAGDPAAVAALARSQERELRGWLSGRAATPGGERRLVAALEAAAGEVESAHGVRVDVVGVGDTALDDRGEAVVAAAREAMVNAAKFAGGGPVSVYAEVSDGGAVRVFVRDRGAGFDPAVVPADRRGVRESIAGRMARHGGRAEISSAPGEGTEVELVLEAPP